MQGNHRKVGAMPNISVLCAYGQIEKIIKDEMGTNVEIRDKELVK